MAGRLDKKLDVITYEYHHPVTGETVNKEVHYYLVEAYNTEITVQLEEINDVHWHTAAEAWDLQRKRGYRNNDNVFRISLPFITADATGPKHMEMNLTRAKFEELTAELVERTMGPTRQALKDAGLTPSEQKCVT